MARVMDAGDVDRAIRRIAHEVLEKNRGSDDLVVLGIQTRGVPLAERLAKALGEIENTQVASGSLDIGMYRDDLDQRPKTELGSTTVPGPIGGKTVILVDDVLYTGRTIRAALDALADIGRPSRIQLAVLVDRGHRELPIRPDYIGKNVPTSRSERVSVRLVERDGEDGVVIESRDET
ncbi:MAG: bifunctional pyr operon transcriptional regulator/uracil phosphoribosyltransferase PyrR [Actinomycetota bacterium]|nr:bifunctional pyr operon transcriptional regulator/uracil phosphoribosyltransferase PyrR [Actinomycetota bacterium]